MFRSRYTLDRITLRNLVPLEPNVNVIHAGVHWKTTPEQMRCFGRKVGGIIAEGGRDWRTDDTWNAIFINGQKIGFTCPRFNIYRATEYHALYPYGNDKRNWLVRHRTILETNYLNHWILHSKTSFSSIFPSIIWLKYFLNSMSSLSQQTIWWKCTLTYPPKVIYKALDFVVRLSKFQTRHYYYYYSVLRHSKSGELGRIYPNNVKV